MNMPLGFLIEVVAFAAAAYVVVALQRRLPQATTDILLAGLGAAMGAEGAAVPGGRRARRLPGSSSATPFAALLLVAHVRALEAAEGDLPRG